MSKRNYIFAVTFCTAWFLFVLACCFGALRLTGHYLPWQRLNDVNVGFRNQHEAIDLAVSSVKGAELVFGEKHLKLAPEQLVPIDDLTEQLNQSFLEWLLCKPLYAQRRYMLSEDAREELNALKTPGSDAYVDLVNKFWVIVPENKGIQFDTDAVLTYVNSMLQKGECWIDCTDFLEFNGVTSESLSEELAAVSWLNTWKASYSSGATLQGYEISEHLDDYSEVVKEFVSTLHEDYDTTDDFYSVGDVDVPYKTFGKSVNNAKEIEAINAALDSHEPIIDRDPEMSGYDKISSDKIIVSIADQNIKVYFDGEFWGESDIVTGRKGVHDTPTGVYYITECINGKYLVGDTYRTWVNKWMRLTNRGIGLHDATWRSSFGDAIYVTNGSHGCINLPRDFAYALYEKAYVGLPVIIY